MNNPTELDPVLARIESQRDLGKSTWDEVVWFDTDTQEWRSYAGSKTFSTYGDRVVQWEYIDKIWDMLAPSKLAIAPEPVKDVSRLHDCVKVYDSTVGGFVDRPFSASEPVKGESRLDSWVLCGAMGGIVPCPEPTKDESPAIAFNDLLNSIGVTIDQLFILQKLLQLRTATLSRFEIMTDKLGQGMKEEFDKLEELGWIESDDLEELGWIKSHDTGSELESKLYHVSAKAFRLLQFPTQEESSLLNAIATEGEVRSQVWNPDVVQRIKELVNPSVVENYIKIWTDENLFTVRVATNFVDESLFSGLLEAGFTDQSYLLVEQETKKEYLFGLCSNNYEKICTELVEDLTPYKGCYGGPSTVSTLPRYRLIRND